MSIDRSAIARASAAASLGALASGRAHLRREQQAATTAGVLGLVHRRVGVADQHRCCVFVGQREHVEVGQRDADTDRELQIEVADPQVAGQRPSHPLGEVEGGDRVGHRPADDEELVAADPGDAVVGAHRFGEPAGGRHEEPVADVVTERVVDVLQPVEVDEERGDVAGPAALAAHRVGQHRA